MKNTRNKAHLLSIIFKNNRLSDYEDILKKAKERDYIVCSVIDYYTKYLEKDNHRKCLLLRHDVDYKTSGTRRMYLLEKKYGYTSTYYFRDSTIDASLISDMHRDGFEVGYHYETLAYSVKAGIVRSREDIRIQELRDNFINELNNFNQIIGFKTESCAGHGAPENLKLGVSNNIIFENIDPRQLGVQVEAYDSRLIDSISCYISDSGIMHNYGYAYDGPQPIDAMEQGCQSICFLSHPHHWDMTPYQRFKKLVRLVIGKGIYHSNLEFRRLDK